MQWGDLTYLLAMAGTAAFAITGVLAVSPKGVDVFGAVVMGVITAIGGGTVRDLILDVPVFWAVDLTYVWVAIGASLVTFGASSLFTRRSIYSLMLYVDALGVALFGIQAADKVWGLAFALPLAPVILGIVTAIGGGLIRDVLAGRQTLLMKHEIYAVPVLLGTSFYVAVLRFFPEYRELGIFLCGTFVFTLRSAAIHWNLTMPDWLVLGPKND